MEGSHTELYLVNSGVRSLRDLPVHRNLTAINLHCNAITRIENLELLRSLQHLDMSSNQIRRLEGLGSLVALRTLNVSCNGLQTVEGLGALKSLRKLDVSFNRITSLNGMREMRGCSYRLSVLVLHGNRIRTVDHVVECLSGCVGLRELTLVQDGKDNPVCRVVGYRKKILSGLEGLQLLDGVNRKGKTAIAEDDLDVIPGVDQYVEYLLSSSAAEDSVEIRTPHIDQALQQFHRQVGDPAKPDNNPNPATASATDSQLNREESQRLPETVVPVSGVADDHEGRLKQLEDQLAALAHQHAATIASLQAHKQPTHETAVNSDSERSGIAEPVHPQRVSAAVKNRALPVSTKDTRQHHEEVHPSRVGANRRPKGQGTRRKQPQETEVAELISELDEERERRLKAEQATKRLVDIVKNLQQRASEDQRQQESAIARLVQFRQTLIREKEESTTAKKQCEELQFQVAELQQSLDSYCDQCERQQESLRDTEKAAAKLEIERIQQQAAVGKELDETRRRSSALSKELELNQFTMKQLKSRIHQLQELLAAREQEHRTQLAERVNVTNPEVKHVVDHELRKEREKWEIQVQHYEERLKGQQQAYVDLEDEFRAALRIEENRFREIQKAFEKATHECSQNRRLGQAAAERESKATALLSELTAVVKEQKGRITELVRSKRETVDDYKERLSSVEVELHQARKEEVRLAAVEEENSKLKAQISAQVSVIEGLRKERELWSEELAQQGAALAQDRGSLEAKVKSLTTQVTDLRLQTQRDNDTIRIKSKMLEDQTESIRQLKQRLSESGEEFKHLREEESQAQDELEDQVRQSHAQNQELEEQVACLVDRKQELKDQLACTRDELGQQKTMHSTMKRQWEERLSSVDSLEHEMQRVKETFASKVKTLTEEKQRAEEQAQSLLLKLRSCDDAFRQQLEAKEQSHDEAILQLEHKKQEEIDLANRKVVEVEEEMRQLLHEMEAEKREREARIQKLAQAFHEVQDGMPG